ncbi:MAG: DUF294 nucleotidyltransferase-like domain-containing protein [Pseudomonadota bacterium]
MQDASDIAQTDAAGDGARPNLPARREDQGADFLARPLSDLMTPDPATVPPGATVADAATVMAERGISCVMVAEAGMLRGILTTGDLASRVLARGLDGAAPLRGAMTERVTALPPDALGADALMLMTERRISHVPVAVAGRLVGIVTQTDLIRAQGVNAGHLIGDILHARDATAIKTAAARIPELLALLVGSGARHQAVTRLVTDVADAATRRLLALGEAELGAAPVPWLWAACGSQGRQEQTGLSDQDNCLILSDEARPEHDAWFQALARFVCEGLDEAGWFLCPGDMMATADRWRKPVATWRGYFERWIAKPDPEAQMLASVMFDLRPIAGDETLFEGLHRETLEAASKNSIFLAHMVSNSLKHHPPLGLLGGLSTVRAGAHKAAIDLKMGGVVPVIDLARIHAMQRRIEPANTRARLTAAAELGSMSASGGHDLLDAYDFIAETRLRHQARQARRGDRPDNVLPVAELSELERGHLRDAFAVVKTMQSAAAQGRGTLT